MEEFVKAIKSGDREKILSLLDSGADIDIIEEDSGRNGLMIALESGNSEIANLLVDRGIALNHSVTEGDKTKTVLDFAEACGNDEIHDIISRKLLANKNIQTAVDDNDAKLVKSLLDQGADINTLTDTGETLLMRAIRKNHFDVAKLLIDCGIDITYVMHNNDQQSGAGEDAVIVRDTAKSYAHKYQMEDIIKMLEEKFEELGLTDAMDDEKPESPSKSEEKADAPPENEVPPPKHKSSTCLIL